MKNIFILNKNLLFIAILTAFTFLNTKAQVGGNQIYRNPNQYDRPVKVFTETNNNYYTTDSTLVINVKVLMNQTADKYKIILGVNEEALTPKKSIEGINQRINGFIKKISSLGIKENNVFVDFISQTKIYDYDIDSNQNTVTQKNKGFETKKNIIITVDKYPLIEKIIYEASDFKIYDVIKVDYMNADIDKIQENLLKEAYAVLDKKKDNYFNLFKKDIIGSPTANSGFSYIFPKSQYQNYSAFESSDVSYMSNRYDASYIRKEERKAKTYYYEGTDYSGFDKVINESNPEVGIQYILSLTVKYDLKKNKK